MNTLIAMLSGALYSASFVAPEPYCYIFLCASTVLVSIMRGVL